MMQKLIHYLSALKLAKVVLWCYFIWYGVIVYFYFEPSPKLWINSIGISAVIGTGLLLSVTRQSGKPDHWQTFRLFLMPFCVSSFSALIKDQGFVIVVSPKPNETLTAVLSCAFFLLTVAVIKLIKSKQDGT
jgi:hypothetical protein